MARDLEAFHIEEGPPIGEEEPQDATLQHNVGARRDQLRKAHADLCSQEARREQLQAQVKLINKQIADTYRKIKSDLGITRDNFEGVREELELDPETRASAQDQRKEVYDALEPPQQLDLLSEGPHPSTDGSQATA